MEAGRDHGGEGGLKGGSGVEWRAVQGSGRECGGGREGPSRGMGGWKVGGTIEGHGGWRGMEWQEGSGRGTEWRTASSREGRGGGVLWYAWNNRTWRWPKSDW